METKQPDMFDASEALAEAKAAGEIGMAQVAAKAELVHPNFSEEAKAFILQYLAAHGPTAGEIINLQCKLAGIQPHDDRAFGPVYLSLSKQQHIEIVGEVPRFRGHGAPGGRIWSLVSNPNAECPHCGTLDCIHTNGPSHP